MSNLGLQSGGKLEVEVYFNVEISVLGKGSQFRVNLEVDPEENMEVIETRVSFYSMLRSRGKEIYSERLNKVFSEEDLATKWRDSKLKHNDKLVLRDPPKHDENAEESDEDVDDEEGEDEMMEEGGEDELEEMNEEGEAEMAEDDANEDEEAGNPEEEEKEGVTAPNGEKALFSN